MRHLVVRMSLEEQLVRGLEHVPGIVCALVTEMTEQRRPKAWMSPVKILVARVEGDYQVKTPRLRDPLELPDCGLNGGLVRQAVQQAIEDDNVKLSRGKNR